MESMLLRKGFLQVKSIQETDEKISDAVNKSIYNMSSFCNAIVKGKQSSSDSSIDMSEEEKVEENKVLEEKRASLKNGLRVIGELRESIPNLYENTSEILPGDKDWESNSLIKNSLYTFYYPLSHDINGVFKKGIEEKPWAAFDPDELKKEGVSVKNKTRILGKTSSIQNNIASRYYNEEKGLYPRNLLYFSLKDNSVKLDNFNLKKDYFSANPLKDNHCLELTRISDAATGDLKKASISIPVTLNEIGKYTLSYYIKIENTKEAYVGKIYKNIILNIKNNSSTIFSSNINTKEGWKFNYNTFNINTPGLYTVSFELPKEALLNKLKIAGLFLEVGEEPTPYDFRYTEYTENENKPARIHPILIKLPLSCSKDWGFIYRRRVITSKNISKSLEQYTHMDYLGNLGWGYENNISKLSVPKKNEKLIPKALKSNPNWKSKDDAWETVFVKLEENSAAKVENSFILKIRTIMDQAVEYPEADRVKEVSIPFTVPAGKTILDSLSKSIDGVTFNLQLGCNYNEDTEKFITYNGCYSDLYFFTHSKDIPEYNEALQTLLSVEIQNKEAILRVENIEEI